MCDICKRADRAIIEGALVSMTTGATKFTIEEIAEKYELDVEELKAHALFHTPLVSAADLEEDSTQATVTGESDGDNANADARHGSLVRNMKLKEADMLAEVSAEYLITLKAMGRRINSLLSDAPEDGESEDMPKADKQLKTAKLLTKPMVELYLGLGSEIRQTVKTAAEVDRMLNGPKDGVASGLTALAAAIRGSDISNG